MWLLDKLKHFIAGESYEKTGKNNSIIYHNRSDSLIQIEVAPNLHLIHTGARMCVGRKPFTEFNEQYEHIGRINKDHESILEHSCLIYILSLTITDSDSYYQLMRLLQNAKYVNYKIYSEFQKTNVLIGGSVRGFIHIVRETDQNNKYLYLIKEILYSSVEKVFLQPLIEHGLLTESRCVYLPQAQTEEISEEQANSDENPELESAYYIPDTLMGKRANLLYNTDMAKAHDILDYGFTYLDFLDMGIVSFHIHDVSRSCANQMTRHRVGISQESQRYCKHTGSRTKGFVNPIDLNLRDRYKNIDKQLLDQIHSINPFEVYKHLLDKKILKEDARAWLPMNCTTQLIMTFTYKQLFHFIKIRMELAAQKEVRLVAREMLRHIAPAFNFKANGKEESMEANAKKMIDHYLMPAAYHPRNESKDAYAPEIDESVDSSVEPEPEPKSLDINDLEDAKKLIDKNNAFKSL